MSVKRFIFIPILVRTRKNNKQKCKRTHVKHEWMTLKIRDMECNCKSNLIQLFDMIYNFYLLKLAINLLNVADVISWCQKKRV